MKEERFKLPKRYTEEQFCKLVDISPRMARRLRQAGQLTHGRVGRKVFYTEDHIRRYYEDRTISAKGVAA